ncbi:unnamed protein product [Protopolystoma xenopodis]|uniref:Ionotropic glutamate receptor L-glutamate and glycine-binding domain-containing protein n=1 Tax=Protopolystoma xenopodis TaxID=117903 RepID=A0A448WFD5_9PLAT|nr:unnamed protein product [Protopolystoma xenopodis]
MMRKLDANGQEIPNEFEGFCIDLIELIAKICNFTYHIQEVKDKNYGAYVNRSWSGMIGELVRQEADIAVAPLTITSSRERVVDFSTPFMEFGLSVMFQKSERPTPAIFEFTTPLSYEIWMCIMLAYLGVSVVLFLVSRFSPQEWGMAELSRSGSCVGAYSCQDSSLGPAVRPAQRQTVQAASIGQERMHSHTALPSEGCPATLDGMGVSVSASATGFPSGWHPPQPTGPNDRKYEGEAHASKLCHVGSLDDGATTNEDDLSSAEDSQDMGNVSLIGLSASGGDSLQGPASTRPSPALPIPGRLMTLTFCLLHVGEEDTASVDCLDGQLDLAELLRPNHCAAMTTVAEGLQPAQRLVTLAAPKDRCCQDSTQSTRPAAKEAAGGGGDGAIRCGSAGLAETTKSAGRLDNEFSIFNSFWFALSAFMQQGGDIVPR